MTRTKNYSQLYRTIVSGSVNHDLIASSRSRKLSNDAKHVGIIGGTFEDQVCLVDVAQHCLKTQFDWCESLGKFGVYTLGSVNKAKRWFLANQSVEYEFVLQSQTTTTVDQVTDIFGNDQDVLEINVALPSSYNHNQTTIKVVVTPKAHFNLIYNDSFKTLFYDLNEHPVIAATPKAVYHGLTASVGLINVLNFKNYETYTLAISND